MTETQKAISAKGAREAAKVCAAAADPVRMRLLCALFCAPGACVSELAKSVRVSVALASHHLKVLVHEGLVAERREGKHVRFRVRDRSSVRSLHAFICACAHQRP